MSELNDMNRAIIEEFHANGGKVGGRFAGGTLLLLHTRGAKSGQVRINPVAYLAEGDRFYVFASKAGGPTNPDWYHNLVAHPDVRVEVGTESFEATATATATATAMAVAGEERDRIYARQAALHPVFAQYQEGTQRKIPVVALTRKVS